MIDMGVILQSADRFSMWVLIWVTYGYAGQITPTWGKYTHVIRVVTVAMLPQN